MLSYLANPTRFMRISGAVLPWLGGATLVALVAGLPCALAHFVAHDLPA